MNSIKKHSAGAAILVIAFALIGYVLLRFTIAGTAGNTSISSELPELTNATLKADSNAKDDSFIEFGRDQAATSSCTIHVSSTGNDNSEGSEQSPLKNPQAAVNKAIPGDTICLSRGEYSHFQFLNKSGSQDMPITVRAIEGDERLAVINGERPTSFAEPIKLANSDHIIISGLTLRGGTGNVLIESSQHVNLENNQMDIPGQTHIHINRALVYSGSCVNFTSQKPSSYITIRNNLFSNSGQTGTLSNRIFSEGIYIGTGATHCSGQTEIDGSSNIVIEDNIFDKTRSEAIDVKYGTYNITIRGNVIKNQSHFIGGAITLGADDKFFEDGDYLVENNIFYNLSEQTNVAQAGSQSAIIVGHGNAIIRNNLIWQVEKGGGIVVTKTFMNDTARNVEISNNTIYTIGQNKGLAINDGSYGKPVDKPGNVTLTGNITNDGSAGSVEIDTDWFVGPLSGEASSGAGIGSGFTIKDYQQLGADLSKIY